MSSEGILFSATTTHFFFFFLNAAGCAELLLRLLGNWRDVSEREIRSRMNGNEKNYIWFH